MYCTKDLTMTKKKADGSFVGEACGVDFRIDSTAAEYSQFEELYNALKSALAVNRESVLNDYISAGRFPDIISASQQAQAMMNASSAPAPEIDPKEVLLDGIQRLMDFFTEFSFTPSFRFANTFSFMACQSKTAAVEYVRNYFALMDSSYIREVTEKIKSAEFKKIVDDIAQYGAPASHINNRFKVYFGPAGTGKTTIAQEESENRCIVCNSSMLPSDLMEDFVFTDGNPDFNPSLLWDCMEQGKTIVLDEINLLPFDSLRFLQGIVDGKTEFYYKNRPVHIHEGFQIIGTMNLSLGGMVYGLPEPLVDRCSSAKEFTLSAKQLAKAIAGWDNI